MKQNPWDLRRAANRAGFTPVLSARTIILQIRPPSLCPFVAKKMQNEPIKSAKAKDAKVLGAGSIHTASSSSSSSSSSSLSSLISSHLLLSRPIGTARFCNPQKKARILQKTHGSSWLENHTHRLGIHLCNDIYTYIYIYMCEDPWNPCDPRYGISTTAPLVAK